MPLPSPPDAESNDRPLRGPLDRAEPEHDPKEDAEAFTFDHYAPTGHRVYINGRGERMVRPPITYAAM